MLAGHLADRHLQDSSAHSGDSSTQRPTLPSRPSIRSFTWQGLETSSWPSSCSLRNDTGFCPCQPLETDRPSYGAMVERRDGPSWLRDDDDDDAISKIGRRTDGQLGASCTAALRPVINLRPATGNTRPSVGTLLGTPQKGQFPSSLGHWNVKVTLSDPWTGTIWCLTTKFQRIKG